MNMPLVKTILQLLFDAFSLAVTFPAMLILTCLKFGRLMVAAKRPEEKMFVNSAIHDWYIATYPTVFHIHLICFLAWAIFAKLTPIIIHL